MQQQPRILIAPLDWGLGHATRCIPIIRLLIKKNAEVIIAADGRPLELLKQEFPTLEFIKLKGYSINYSENNSMILKMFLSIPKILSGIYREHKALKRIIKEKNIDIIISDNRFGLWNKQIKSIFITHQLVIKSPFAEILLHRINLYFINKYNECWIPDMQGEINLSGDLSHKYPLPSNAFFIGILSRFQKQKEEEQSDCIYDVTAILSGPEPQRTILEKIIVEQLSITNLKALIVRGITEKIYEEQKGNIKLVNHLNADEMQNAILQSAIILARSGYSTIMDLATLGKKAIFIPTPGQTEQEYLAEALKQKKIAFFQKQLDFSLNESIYKSKDYNRFEIFSNNIELEKRINLLLNIKQ